MTRPVWTPDDIDWNASKKERAPTQPAWEMPPAGSGRGWRVELDVQPLFLNGEGIEALHNELSSMISPARREVFIELRDGKKLRVGFLRGLTSRKI